MLSISIYFVMAALKAAVKNPKKAAELEETAFEIYTVIKAAFPHFDKKGE